MAKEHSGGRPDTVWQRLEVGAWSEEKFPVPITRFPMEKVFADLDGPEGDSQAAVQAKAALEALRVFLRWVRGEGRLGGQRTRLHVLYRVFLPEEYEGKTDLEMARLAGLRSKQAFSKEKLAFARAYGFRERNMRSPAACLSMKRSYASRHPTTGRAPNKRSNAAKIAA